MQGVQWGVLLSLVIKEIQVFAEPLLRLSLKVDFWNKTLGQKENKRNFWTKNAAFSRLLSQLHPVDSYMIIRKSSTFTVVAL